MLSFLTDFVHGIFAVWYISSGFGLEETFSDKTTACTRRLRIPLCNSFILVYDSVIYFSLFYCTFR